MNSSEAFLVCISAFDTTGSKTADKVFLDCDKKNNNWHCCKQRGCKQILPFHHIVAIEDCNTDCQRFQDICRNQCQSNGIFVPGVDEYENQGSNDTRCCYRKKDTDQGRNLSTAVYGSCLFHFRRNGDKGTAQQPDCKCLVKCCVDKDQADNAVGKVTPVAPGTATVSLTVSGRGLASPLTGTLEVTVVSMEPVSVELNGIVIDAASV